MKSFVVMTYYQLMHSIAMALMMDDKPNLYFSKNYLNINDEFIERINETNVFNEVVGITGRGDLKEFLIQLRETKDYTDEQVDETGDTIFEEYLEPYYADLFKNADFNDTIYVYNDFQWYMYYINKHFNEIVGVEDGYGSLSQQLNVHVAKGDLQLVEKFYDKYYPRPLYKSTKIKRIISSVYFSEIPNEYNEKLDVMDFNDIVKLNMDAFRKAIFHIFDVKDLKIKDNSVLILGQPLSRSKYCNNMEEYLFYRKLIEEEVKQGNQVIFKGHPAETVPSVLYESEMVTVLPKSFPVEILNYKECYLKKILSFGSTGAKTLKCAKTIDTFFSDEIIEISGIKKSILDYIKNEKMTIDFFVIARELTLEGYINAYSCYVTAKRLYQRVHIIVPPEIEEEAREFYDKSNLKNNIKKYELTKQVNGTCIWKRELSLLLNTEDDICQPDIISCDNCNSDDELIDIIKHNPINYDYIMIVEENNLMFNPMRRIWGELKYRIQSGVFFRYCTNLPVGKSGFAWMLLNAGYIGSFYSPSIVNKLWHRNVLTLFINTPDYLRTELMFDRGFTFAKKFSNTFCIPRDRILSAKQGEKFYADRINNYLNTTETCSDDTISSIVALEICNYLDYRKLVDGKNNDVVILEFLELINLPVEIKTKLLAKMSATFMFEKSLQFFSNYGEEYDYRRYIVERVGKSKKILKGIEIARKYNNRLKRIKQR